MPGYVSRLFSSSPLLSSVARGLPQVALYLLKLPVPSELLKQETCACCSESVGGGREQQKNISFQILSLKTLRLHNSPSLLAPLPSSPWCLVRPSSTSLWPLAIVWCQCGGWFTDQFAHRNLNPHNSSHHSSKDQLRNMYHARNDLQTWKDLILTTTICGRFLVQFYS